MPSSPHKLSKFWQELKRRNVVRVVTVYAGAAFVILELVDMIREPFELPNWSFKLVVVILSIGLIIAIILSWIYDIHPGGGIVKTEPADKIKPEEPPKSSKGWKIASYISFVVIVGLIILNVISRDGKKEILDKSIAVLPFINDSPDEEKMYFINGTMDAILDNLCKIADLRVVSRNSVEQYRDNPKPTPVVAEEMNVSYVLEGSGQKIGNRVLLIVQLIDGTTDHHLWSKQYDREIQEVEDLIDIQVEIAKLVAVEIKAIITPEENTLIEKIPTTNLTAYDFYQRGNEELLSNWWNPAGLDKVEELFYKALNYDPAYGQAYLGLAKAYRQKNTSTEYLSENYLDSALVLINTALSYDNTLADAYVLRGDYYRDKGYPEQAIKEYDRALKINPNSWEVYRSKYVLYADDNQLAAIDNLYKFITNVRGSDLPIMLVYFGRQLAQAGFLEIGKTYVHKGYNLIVDDTLRILRYLGDVEALAGNWEEAVRLYTEYCTVFPSHPFRWFEIGCYYGFLGQDAESLKFLEKWFASLDETLYMDNQYNGLQRLGYAYWKNNRSEEATYYFDLQMKNSNRCIELDLPYARQYFAYFDKAGIYAFRGEREKAYENLRIFNRRERNPAWVYQLIKIDPLFDTIRDEPEFQQIVRDVEAKYQAEHERVRKWLEENEML